MTTVAEYQAKAERDVVNMDRYNQFINGTVPGQVTTDTGTFDNLPTLASKARVSVDGASQARDQAVAARMTTEQIRDQFANTAASAQAAVLALANGLYQTVSSGLAATAANGYFAVASGGDVAVTIYQKVNGAAVLVNIMASQAALDRVGRGIVAAPNVDASATITAALAVSTVYGANLPAGIIRLDRVPVVPSGKFVRGAGRDVTILNRVTPRASNDELDGSVIRSAAGALGVRISDLTCIAPKGETSINGIHMREAKGFAVERVRVINPHYGLWAQDGQASGTFRDFWVQNANVYCEATAARRVLFQHGYCDDGDSDNPSGHDAVLHPILGAKQITFDDVEYTGAAVFMQIAANDGAGDAGLVDQIIYRNCRAVITSGKLGLEVRRYNGTVGKITILDCEVEHTTRSDGGATGTIEAGQITIRDNKWKNKNADGIGVAAAASLEVIDSKFYMEGIPGTAGAFFGADGKVEIVGGSLRTPVPDMAAFVTSGTMKGEMSPHTVFDNTNPFAGLTNKGRRAAWVYPEQAHADGFQEFGQGVAGQPPSIVLGTPNGAYRVRARGRIRKTGAAGSIYLATDAPLASGSLAIQKADGSMAVSYGQELRVDAAADDVRNFAIDVTFLADGNNHVFGFGQGGATLLAGAELSIERLS